MLESSVEDYLRQEVEKAGGRAEKTVDLTRIGCPDREVQWPLPLLCAGVDKVELKRPVGGRVSTPQRRYHQYLATCGVPVYLLDTRHKVDVYVRARVAGHHCLALFSVPCPAAPNRFA